MAIIICSKIKKCSKSVDCTGWLLASSIYTVSWCSQCAWQSKDAGIRQLLPPTPFEITSRPKCNHTISCFNRLWLVLEIILLIMYVLIYYLPNPPSKCILEYSRNISHFLCPLLHAIQQVFL